MDVKAPLEKEEGNEQCVALLEKWLAKAKEGGINHLAIAGVEAPNIIYNDIAGSMAMQATMHCAIEAVKTRIDNCIMERMPPRDPSIPYNQVCFNVAMGMVSYDFLPWLIGAEMYRVRHGCEEKLKISFFRHEGAAGLPTYHAEMLKNVATPMVGLLGGEINKVFGGKFNFSMLYKDVTKAYREGEPMPMFKPIPEAAEFVKKELGGIHPVTITLREATHYPWRNSNMQAWLGFAKHLEAQGEEVIFLRDTRFADVELDDFSIFGFASSDIHVRTALYAQAKHNYFVSNGPMTLNYHLDTPFTAFIEVDDDHSQRYRPGWPEFWQECMGIECGGQFPWFNDEQRIIWKRDTFQNLMETWQCR